MIQYPLSKAPESNNFPNIQTASSSINNPTPIPINLHPVEIKFDAWSLGGITFPTNNIIPPNTINIVCTVAAKIIIFPLQFNFYHLYLNPLYFFDNYHKMYDKCNIQKRYYKIHTFKELYEELSEIVISDEHTISLYPRFYTPINNSSICNATPPIINKAHKNIGIADIPNILVIADSPIQPNTPSTIIIVGGVLAKIVAISCIFYIPLHRQINSSASILGHLLYPSRVVQNQYLQKTEIQDNSDNQINERTYTLFEGVTYTHPFFFFHPFLKSFTVKKKQKNVPPIYFLSIRRNISFNVFSYNLFNDLIFLLLKEKNVFFIYNSDGIVRKNGGLSL